MQPNGHRVGSKNNNNFPGVFRKLYGNHRLNFVNSNEAKVFQDSPDSKIPTLSEAMRGQNVTKLDLLARNEAVSFYVILIFSKTSLHKVEVEARENLYKGASYDNPKLMLCMKFSRTGIPIIFISFQFCYWFIGLVHIYSSGIDF